MKTFETISELGILRAALTTITECWSRYYDRLQDNPENEIAAHHVRHLQGQIDELRTRIIELESE